MPSVLHTTLPRFYKEASVERCCALSQACQSLAQGALFLRCVH